MAFLGLDSPAKKLVFLAYISLWVSYGMLNERVKRRHIEFDTSAAVFVQAFIKLGIATTLYCQQDGPFSQIFTQLRLPENRRLFVMYLIPAGLYAGYDILSYVCLSMVQPTTYSLLLQMKTVITGLMHQAVFGRKLNRNQWISLLVTTTGVMVTAKAKAGGSQSTGEKTNIMVYGLIAIQICASAFASIYTELLLKKQKQASLNLQNIIMYVDSMFVLFILLGLGVSGKSLTDALSRENFFNLFAHWEVISMMLLMSSVGIVASMFMKLLDSIRKGLASALELVFLPVISAFFFGIPIHIATVLSVALVSMGTYLYSVPVEKEIKNDKQSAEKDEEQAVELLPTTVAKTQSKEVV